MREKLAILFCLLTVAVALLLSLTFAELHNRPAEAPPPAVTKPEHPGRRVFHEQGCATCHSFAGSGNPRLPLDEAAARLNDGELRDWITGSGSATNKLSPTILKRKSRYQSLPADEFNQLVNYLGGSSP